MHLYHDSFDIRFRNPGGALECTASVAIRIRAIGADRVFLRFYNGSEFFYPMDMIAEELFEYTLTMPDVPMLCWYDFRAENNEGDVLYYGNNAAMLGGTGEMSRWQPRGYQITVYEKGYTVPAFMREGTMYQIFPDRFYASPAPRALPEGRKNAYLHEVWDEEPVFITGPDGKRTPELDFFGGNLKGIEEKLPYLKKLGITVVYLNPIFMARSNHRYDTADYTKVDPLLGTEEDLTELCRAAEALGMRVILDGVFSHTGDDSVYFDRYDRYHRRGACTGEKSPYYSWYTFEHFPDKYRCWWGFTSLPEINKRSPSYNRFMFSKDGVVRRWLRRGTSGWRLDVADELPMDFLRALRRAAKREKPDSLVLGEVWEDASHKVAYGEMRCYCTGDTLDSVMNYPLREAVMNFLTFRSSAFTLCRIIQSQKENYPKPFYYSLMNLAGSHDRARAVNYLAGRTFEELEPEERRGRRLTEEEYRLGKARYLMMLSILCALPGTPCVYYGDEIGMQGAPDPFCRAPYQWEGGDTEMLRKVSGILNERLASPLLKTGDVEAEAPDDDTLIIRRFIRDGKDVFGEEQSSGEIEMVFNRRDAK